ncbi:MAG TPA: RNA-binding cell elongation regulator Jag/EloR [Candidatus Binataceae bacterium]|nr:RNA-binding cell elongation regulator Jag/EloR [Candidatus Binataceae bacterium]
MSISNDSIEVTAVTVDAAIQQALEQLGAQADDVAIEVLSTPRSGLLGLGARQAKVRVTRRAPEAAQSAVMSPPPAPPPKPRSSAPPPRPQVRPTQPTRTARPAAPPIAPLPPEERPGAREMPAEEEALVEALTDDRVADLPQAAEIKAQPPPAGPARRASRPIAPLPAGERTAEREMPAEEGALIEGLTEEQAASEDPRQFADPKAQLAEGENVLAKILEMMGEKAVIEIARDDDPELLELNIKGDGSGLLIGRHGQTLDALEYLVNRILARRIKDAAPISIDTESYRARRRGQLHRMALSKGEEAKREHQVVTLEPMPPRDRRIIHLALKDDPLITTRSDGDGFLRSIQIVPVDGRREGGSGGAGGGRDRRRGRGSGPRENAPRGNPPRDVGPKENAPRHGGPRENVPREDNQPLGEQGGFKHGQKRIV